MDQQKSVSGYEMEVFQVLYSLASDTNLSFSVEEFFKCTRVQKSLLSKCSGFLVVGACCNKRED